VLGDAIGQRLGDVRTGSEAHVGHPQRQHVLTSEHLLASVNHYTAGSTAVYHAVKVISSLHVSTFYVLFLPHKVIVFASHAKIFPLNLPDYAIFFGFCLICVYSLKISALAFVPINSQNKKCTFFQKKSPK
jgi:hypothetical protein